MVTMEPNKYCSIFGLMPPSVILIKNNAKDNPAVINMAIDTSEYDWYDLRIYSIPMAPIMTTAIPDKVIFE